MHHNTYDRFGGSWWGGIIGQTIVNQADALTQPWVLKRRQIAEMLLSEKLNRTNLALFLAAQSADSRLNEVNNWQDHSNLLSWLPSIILQTDEPNLYLRLMQPDFKSAHTNSNIVSSQNILIWSYLLATVLNHQTRLGEQALSIEEMFNHNLILKSPLIEKLSIVLQGIKSGSSLQQITEQLSSKDQLQATAIALAWYCFVTTPNDFKLSIQRAARVDSKLSWLTITLTSTLSGAYNGMTAILGNRRTDIEQNHSWQLENHLLLKLLRFWLGVYAVEQNYEAYNLELDAIALPQFIQPRQSLKIISQLLSNKN
ncbi:hypothetical protein C7B62_00825 [Pleurocapsa sp. CCALA 161]|uniref:hypothetical protein n=1 Tax=Pleurocapsa sp. CCALA 161 TaxID=2107688 RepID=UPI000D06936E|nr:hypothetical protein [Pleurocapsa sp. CCALA 161]PSB12658.1 hypothetical protein C7B62_00825 [Pleurocapsa sp. CCALA 161]